MKVIEEQINNLQRMVEYECSRRCILETKLEIATKALKRIYQPTVGDIYNFETDELDHIKLQDIAYKALKEREENESISSL